MWGVLFTWAVDLCRSTKLSSRCRKAVHTSSIRLYGFIRCIRDRRKIDYDRVSLSLMICQLHKKSTVRFWRNCFLITVQNITVVAIFRRYAKVIGLWHYYVAGLARKYQWYLYHVIYHRKFQQFFITFFLLFAMDKQGPPLPLAWLRHRLALVPTTSVPLRENGGSTE